MSVAEDLGEVITRICNSEGTPVQLRYFSAIGRGTLRKQSSLNNFSAILFHPFLTVTLTLIKKNI